MIELLNSEEIKQNIHRISESNKQFVRELKQKQQVLNARSMGVILAFELHVEMERYGNLRDKLFRFFMDNGLFLRPLGNTIYIVPPYVTTEEQMTSIYKLLQECINQFQA